jgi:hypothetical protein
MGRGVVHMYAGGWVLHESRTIFSPIDLFIIQYLSFIDLYIIR